MDFAFYSANGFGHISGLSGLGGMESLEKRAMGRTGVKVTALGFGAWPIGGTKYGVVSENEAIETIETYFAAGGNHIDTARGYGNSISIPNGWMYWKWSTVS